MRVNLLLVSAVLIFAFGIYQLLKVVLESRTSYNSLRGKMEKVRKALKEEELSGKYNEDEFSKVVEKFNQNAKELKISEYTRRGARQ